MRLGRNALLAVETGRSWPARPTPRPVHSLRSATANSWSRVRTRNYAPLVYHKHKERDDDDDDDDRGRAVDPRSLFAFLPILRRPRLRTYYAAIRFGTRVFTSTRVGTYHRVRNAYHHVRYVAVV